MLRVTLLCVLLQCVAVYGRPKEVIALEYKPNEESTEETLSTNQLSPEETTQYEQIKALIQKLNDAGIDIGKKDTSILVIHVNPNLYDKLVSSDERVDALPDSLTNLIKAQKQQTNELMRNGVSDGMEYQMVPMEMVAMAEAERQVVLQYYVHVAELLKNPVFKAILAQLGNIEDELIAVMQHIANEAFY
ncbi:hypothetical protein QR680_015817 [Steinernema hermaphroditum]|uniref:Uncharacterized protein n=1 Tax=Steinernema hermaphroditum TaxID=289476 RepID=A0AA39HAX2_9BILA|nr:hypothetical protein QR680_015817 [Steinernema hermaphroditum]